VPVPLVIPLTARVPAARVFMLAAISFAEMFAETTRGAVVPLAILLLVQALVAMGLLWIIAYGISRLLAGASNGLRAAATLLLVLSILAVTTADSLYRDPYRSETLHANLTEVYQ
jgi:hypothetical protein